MFRDSISFDTSLNINTNGLRTYIFPKPELSNTPFLLMLLVFLLGVDIGKLSISVDNASFHAHQW